MNLEEAGNGRINVLAFVDENYISNHGGTSFNNNRLGNICNAVVTEVGGNITLSGITETGTTTDMSARHHIGLNARHDVYNAGDMVVEDAYKSEEDNLVLGISLLAGYKMGTNPLIEGFDKPIEGECFGHGDVYNLGNFIVDN